MYPHVVSSSFVRCAVYIFKMRYWMANRNFFRNNCGVLMSTLLERVVVVIKTPQLMNG